MATRHRFGVEGFKRLLQGVKHLELLEGEVCETSPIGPRLVFTGAQLDNRLQALLAEEEENLLEVRASPVTGVYRHLQGDGYRLREMVFPDRTIPWS
ncbi:MAG: hypothetical protein ACK4G4_00260 [Thermus sp.]|uniref:hypothetical protein n=1 Tax=Thermus sp. TaxID=275 RepID=UPI003918B186